MRYIFVFIFLFTTFLSFAQQNINIENIKKHIYYLASDSLKGRGTGSEGQKMAAEYISENFRQAGLFPAGNVKENPYLQQFCIYKPKKTYAFISADTVVPSKRLKANAYFNGEIVPVIFNETDYRNMQHFLYISSPKQFSDKICSVVTEENFTAKSPSQKMPAVMLSSKDMTGVSEKVEKMYYFGVKTFIVEVTGNKIEKILVNFPEDKFLFGNEEGKNAFYRLGMLRPHKLKLPGEIYSLYSFCKQHPDCEVFIAGPQIRKAIFPENNNASAFFRFSAYTSGLWDSTVTENVVGILEGKTKDIIVTGAHYDHVGSRGDDIYYGADDNASGTAAVMETAREMAENAKAGKLPEKSIVFVAFTAEEEGLIGSEAFLLNYPYTDRKIFMMVNMDMIGRNDKRNDTLTHYVYSLPLGGRKCRTNKAVRKASEDVLQTNITGKPDVMNRLLYRFGSDHHGFVRRGIPSVVFFTGLHDDYHKTTDTPDKIWYTNATDVTKVVCRVLYILAGEKK